MSATSTIEWTDATWNPVRRCKKISPGCKHCYATGADGIASLRVPQLNTYDLILFRMEAR